MNFSHVPFKCLITGTSGSGKTTLYIELLKASKARWKFIFDGEGECAQRLHCAPALTPDDCTAQLNDGVCLFDPVQLYPGRTEAGFDRFCRYAFTLAQKLPGKKLFAFDEGQKLINTHQVSHSLECILDTGRRYELDLVCIAQSPNLIHTRLRNQLTHVVSFRQSDKRAVVFLEDCGFDSATVRALQPGQFIWRDLNTGQMGSGEVFKARALPSSGVRSAVSRLSLPASSAVRSASKRKSVAKASAEDNTSGTPNSGALPVSEAS